ncbi:GcrA family cell cycle regulator [Shinella granuli]
MSATSELQAPEPAPVPRPLADLDRYACRWPVNNAELSEAHLFCGERAATAKPYCTRHCRLAYRAAPTATRKRG